jgi:hypothetical protein
VGNVGNVLAGIGCGATFKRLRFGSLPRGRHIDPVAVFIVPCGFPQRGNSLPFLNPGGPTDQAFLK